MHPRRSNSLTGTAKVSDLNGTTSKAKPKKATSLDVPTGVGGAAGYGSSTTNGGGPGDGDPDLGHAPPPGDLASTALTVAHNAYVTIETRADELLDRLDETFEAIENGPIAQTAINTVHRVGEVIDDRVLKRVKLAPEVEEVLHGIENTEVVRVAIEKVREAKDYGERILTRLGSQESEDESAGVDFVIPPHFVKAQTPYSNSFVLPDHRTTSFDHIDPYSGTVDVSPFTPDLPDDISYRAPGGFVDLTPDDSDRKNHSFRQRNDSLCSAADSEPYFEFVKSNPTFRSPPYSQQPPPPFPRTNSPDFFDPRKSILVQCNHRGEVKNALIDVPADSNGRSNDFSVPSKYNGGENPRFVRFIERYGGGGRGGADQELCPSTKATLERGEEDPLGGRVLPDSIICGKAFTQYNTSSNSNSNDVDETSPLLEKGRRLPSIAEAKKRNRNDQEKHRHLPACPPRRRRRLLPPIPQKQPLPHPNLLKQDKPRKLQRQDSKHPKDDGGEDPTQEKPPMQYLQVPPRIQPQAPPPPSAAPKPKSRTENLHLYIPGVGFPQDPNRPLPLPNVRQGIKLSGLTEEQILDKFHGRMHDLVCIDGEMYYIVKKAKRKGTLGVFGGASMLLEGSSEDNLDKLSACQQVLVIAWCCRCVPTPTTSSKGAWRGQPSSPDRSVPPSPGVGAEGRDPNPKRPTWVRRFFSGLENFINNAHDPWLSEADRDPLACEGCGRWFKKWFHVGGRRSTIGLSNYTNNETFCVVSKRFRKNYVHRFSASKSLFLFSPWHPLRRAAIFLSTNQYFDYIVMTTILLNCVFLAMTKPVDEAEYMFLAIYSMEMMIKTVAKGFILNKYTYLRNPWNWLDFVVIASGYVTLGIEVGDFDVQLGNLAGLRTFRVLRALKTVSIMPGLKTIINALLNSIKQLVEVMTLTVFCLMVFALFALQVYMGVLKNKCVKNFDQVNSTDEEWLAWVNNTSNWYREKGSELQDSGGPPVLCGNATGARVCPPGYECLPDIGENPNFGYTNFDNFLWSMLTTFQLITLDYWEDVYNKIIATGGPLQVIFFSIVVFFGSFYLINLMLAVVAMSYEEEAENTEEEKTKDLMDHRDDSTFSFDPEKLTHAKPLEKKKPKNRRIIVMRRGAGILSDTFSKKKNKKKDKNGTATPTPEHESPKGPIAPMKIKEGQLLTIDPPPRRGSQQVSSRPASLIITRDTPPAGGSPAATGPTQCNAPPRSPLPEARVRIIAGEGPVGGPGERVDNDSGVPRTAGSSTCEPCTSASRARCCQCQCHTGVPRAGHESHGVVAVRGGDAAAGEGGEGLLVPGSEASMHGGAPPRPMPCDDPSRPHLRLANNAPHRQPSLDDSGVVGDHDGGDNISLHHMPNLIQDPESKAELMVYTRKKCNGVSPSSPAALSASSQHIVVVEDELEDRNCERCRECCVNNRCWLKFQNKLNNIVVQGAVFDLFITLCIILNTIFLAIEHHGMSKLLHLILEVGNRVFTVVFTLECILKIMALSREFFVNRWNVFDLVIVLASLLDLGLEIGSGLSVLRGMRLLRVLKLAQSWRTMRVLLSIIVSTLGALGNLTFVLIIIIYIFAVIGMQLFGKDYTEENFYPDPIPRWNFTDFFHSFMMIFRILCGEWVEPLWDCMRAEKDEGSKTCLAIFLPALVMGNFMVLNLFLALLLNSFNSEELKSRQDDMEDESKVVQLLSRMKDAIFRCLRIKKKKKNKELEATDEKANLEDDVRADVMKQAFSEPELRQRCEDEDDLARGDPQTQGYERMNIVDDDRPEIIELSDMHPTVTNSYKNTDASRDYPFAHRQGQETLESTYTQESTYAPSHVCPEHENEYRQLQYPEINLQQETSSYNNEDSVSEVNLSDSNISKMKLNEVSFPEMRKDLQMGNEAAEGVKKDVPLNKTQSWSTVINYVENITSGVKDDDDPRFIKQEKKAKEPVDCFPKVIYKRIPCCLRCTQTKMYRKWYNVRRYILYVVDSPYFEWFILLMIFASSVTLCFEDVHLDSKKELKERREILNYLNIAFAVLFTIEMFLKWISFGFVKYFTSVWTLLDCFIVLVSVCSLFIEQDNLIALRSLRTLRALRPLRAISRWQGMKIVVNALMYAIPSIFNVLLVCLVFWLIFSIMGVQMFGGKFYKCVNRTTGDLLPISEVENKTQCLKQNHIWINSKINFDHVGYAYLALFQVATFEGWMEVMEDAVDCRGVDKQPSREANIYAYIYFVIFIVCGSFFTLNLFIGVIIDNFNMLKKKYEGGVLEMFLTDSQKNYYTAMKKLGRKKPQKVIRRPKHHYHALFYDIAVSRRFEISIFVLIFLNMVTMAIEHYHQSRTIAFTLEVFNALFTTIFALEAIVKMIGLRHHYFTVPWNLFDFILVFASIMGIVLQDVLTNFPISPTLLRVVRVFRIGRILRLIKPTVNGRGTFFGQAAKGIRKLLFALIVSLPALFNIGALLFLITFIYAIIGMAVFGHVQRNGALDDLVNFETFGSSMMLLFRLITSAGWNDVLDPLMTQPPECDPYYMDQPNGNCGHPIIAIVFFVSFIIINFMIVINMYIAVILENFNQAHKEEEIGIVEDDLEMFYVRWSKYDPHATQFINFSQLSDFIASLDAPFGIPKPNTVALVSFDLPIAKGDKIHCLDILHALTKHVLGHVEETEEFKRLKMQMEEKFKKQFPTRKELEIVSSTRRWKKMDTAAKTIQIGWRVFLRRRREMDKKNLLLEEAQTQTSSPGGSSIRSGFKRVSNLLQVVPMPMAIQARRRSINHGDGGSRPGSRRASRSSINEHTTSPRGSLLFFPISRRASRTSQSSNPSLISVQIHQTGDRHSTHSQHSPDYILHEKTIDYENS